MKNPKFEFKANNSNQQSAPTSLPFILSVENTTDEPIESVDILSGNPPSGIVIKCCNYDPENRDSSVTMTYEELLDYFDKRELVIGMVYISSTIAIKGIVPPMVALQGKPSEAHPQQANYIYPLISPYQLQEHVTATACDFLLNSGTKLFLSEIAPKNKIQFNLYPTSNQLA